MCANYIQPCKFKEAPDITFSNIVYLKYLAMDSLKSFPLLSLIFLVFTFSASAFNMPRLGTQRRRTQHEPQTTSSTSDLGDLKTYYYTQTLDHFNYRPDSYTTFKQRYVINYRFWGGANASAPIFAYLGAEESLDDDLPIIGFLSDNAPRFQALQVYIEVKLINIYR
jgi:lysosomal Pro-X carboxypeptidase